VGTNNTRGPLGSARGFYHNNTRDGIFMGMPMIEVREDRNLTKAKSIISVEGTSVGEGDEEAFLDKERGTRRTGGKDA